MRKQSFIWGLLLALVAVPVLAQRNTATLRGTVKDPSGGVVAGAKVTVRDEATGLTRTAETNAAGVYSFELPVGNYEVMAEKANFKVASVKGVVLNVADVRAQDISLTTGAVTETVTVEAAANEVKTIGGDVSGLITGEQVRELPLNGRNFVQLTMLMPGVSAPDFLSSKDKGLQGGVDISVSGSSVTSNLWTVDGANNNDVGSNRTILVYPSVEAIEEFKIHRNSYGAEFGQAGGAQVNIVTRRGSNDFHGSVFYFGRNDKLNEKNYFLKKNNQDKEELSRHDFGWSLGGAIIKEKLHFFASQEWNIEKRGVVRSSFVPTEAERRGDFSGPAIAGCSGSTPIDPTTGAAFPGNRIPQNRISQAGLTFLQLFPAPNVPPAAGTCSNWVASVNSPVDWRQENLRVDYTLSDSMRLMARYTQDSWSNEAPNTLTYWGDDPFPAIDSNWDQPGRSLILQLNNTIGHSAVNTFQFSYSANEITVTRGGENPGLNDQITNAIPTVWPIGGKRQGNQIGHPVWWGAGSYGNIWNEAPFKNNQDLFVFRDDYSRVFGRHHVKVGALASFNKKNEVGGGGWFESPHFWGTGVGLNGAWGAETGNYLANVLLDGMMFGFDEFDFEPEALQRWSDYEAYVSDSWQIKPNVTLDFGVRYSFLKNPVQADDKVASFDPGSFNPALGNDACNGLLIPPGTNWCGDLGLRGGKAGPNRSLIEEHNMLFAPRIGIAWDVNRDGKTAVRAGLGQFYTRERLGKQLFLATQNPPFAKLRTGLRTLDGKNVQLDSPAAFGRPLGGHEVGAGAPHNWQWNVSVQRELKRNTTVEVAYVGNKGRNLLRRRDINQVPSQNRLAYVRASMAADAGAAAAQRPFGVFGDSTIVFYTQDGESNYHSLQAQLVSRFGRGSQFQASYTLAQLKANDPLDDSGGGNFAGNVTDIENQDADYGLSPLSRKHVFNASLVLALPTFEDKGGAAKHVLGDWQVNAIAQYSSGQPMTVYIGGSGVGGGLAGTGYGDNQRPNVTGQSCEATSGPDEQILNPNAFTLAGYRLGTLGDAGRGICTGPRFFNVDLSLYKNIKLSNRLKAQLRFEVFNVLNTTNFMSNFVDNNLDPSDVAFDSTTPATATSVRSATIPLTFGQASRARDPRQMQLGIRFLF